MGGAAGSLRAGPGGGKMAAGGDRSREQSRAGERELEPAGGKHREVHSARPWGAPGSRAGFGHQCSASPCCLEVSWSWHRCLWHSVCRGDPVLGGRCEGVGLPVGTTGPSGAPCTRRGRKNSLKHRPSRPIPSHPIRREEISEKPTAGHGSLPYLHVLAPANLVCAASRRADVDGQPAIASGGREDEAWQTRGGSGRGKLET